MKWLSPPRSGGISVTQRRHHRVGSQPITAHAVVTIVPAHAAAAGFGGDKFGRHSLKRGALTTGMDRRARLALLKRLGCHRSFDVLEEHLEFRDLFEGHPLSGVV